MATKTAVVPDPKPVPAAASRETVERKTITIPAAGRALGISRNAAYEAARRGEIPTIRIGRLLLVPKVAFERMLERAGDRRAVEAA
jgi:excisionase family DNA binding protein